ncbi:hypothetical protein ES332_D07G126100v1 [Gossypium tomentosum]|uniref:Uncharacterized protein n=1 Tax=Gossypium tomentosum TaxID=34277 RepID=A0A5D2K6C5_GOSTO|nr:hypothetical protein ES332_D07G126100v1 [Gossypium tomentosum]
MPPFPPASGSPHLRPAGAMSATVHGGRKFRKRCKWRWDGGRCGATVVVAEAKSQQIRRCQEAKGQRP